MSVADDMRKIARDLVASLRHLVLRKQEPARPKLEGRKGFGTRKPPVKGL